VFLIEPLHQIQRSLTESLPNGVEEDEYQISNVTWKSSPNLTILPEIKPLSYQFTNLA
jgi:hypothetical protein